MTDWQPGRTERASGVERRAAIRPRRRLLELRRDGEQQVLAPVRGDQLHADRQARRASSAAAARSAGWPDMLNGSVQAP